MEKANLKKAVLNAIKQHGNNSFDMVHGLSMREILERRMLEENNIKIDYEYGRVFSNEKLIYRISTKPLRLEKVK